VLAAALAAMVAALLFALGGARPPTLGFSARWLAALALAVYSLVTPGGVEGDRITPSKGLAQDLRRGARVVETRPNTNGRVDVVERATTGFVWGIGKSFNGVMPEHCCASTAMRSPPSPASTPRSRRHGGSPTSSRGRCPTIWVLPSACW
jgi:hypothetical protein